MSDSCNDFIINKGEFVRNFEEMYSSIDDPWNQAANSQNDVPVLSTIFFLKVLFPHFYNKKINVFDIGCANGYHSAEFHKYFSNCSYMGSDISKSIILKANSEYSDSKTSFCVDDCRILNNSFNEKYNIVFSSRALYYVSPEISSVLENIKSYLVNDGIFSFVYNQKTDSFTNQYLTYSLLRSLLIQNGFKENLFVEFNRFSSETIAVGIYTLPKI